MSAYEQYVKRQAAWAELMAYLGTQPVKPEWYFKGMSEATAQNWVGERLYPLAHAKYPKHAGKITGMILEGFTVPEVYALLGDEEKRNATIEEAEAVLQKFEAAAAAAQNTATATTVAESAPVVESEPTPDVTQNKGDAANASSIYKAMMAKKGRRGGR